MGLEFHHISHAYGRAPALHDVSLTAAPGEITCLLGPSGCGKTTLLRLAAGLLPLQAGEIHLDGMPLARPGHDPAPEDRPVGLVFQEGALFPHLTVADNIGFGVADKAERDPRVTDLLDRIGLPAFGGRYPHTLSGGQQQRVALARALAPAPRVLLLDEPFANIDIQRRRALREETRHVLKQAGGIAILVTHDPEEALEMADQIAVLEEGCLVQAGRPGDLYDNPATLGVASLIGDALPLSAQVGPQGVETPFGVWPRACLHGDLPPGPVSLAIRAAALTLVPDTGGYPVTDLRVIGDHQRVTVSAPCGTLLVAHQPREATFTPGTPVRVQPHDGAIFAFPAEQ